MKKRIVGVCLVLVMLISLSGYNVRAEEESSENVESMIADQIFEKDNWRYYIDEVEGGKIYRTNMEMNDVQLVADVNAFAFFIIDDWIYYLEALDATDSEGDIYRINIDGSGKTVLYDSQEHDDSPATNLIYANDRLYSMHRYYKSDFTSMKLDGSDFRSEKENIPHFANHTIEGNIIYSKTSTGVTSYNTVTETLSEWTSDDIQGQGGIYHNGWVYSNYYDNVTKDRRIIRVNYATKLVETVTDQFYNGADFVAEGHVLYLNVKVNSALNKVQKGYEYIIKFDASTKKIEVVREGKGQCH